MSTATPAAHPSSPPRHAAAFRTRRFLNWFPLGLAYAFLYMGRYNLTVAKTSLGDLMTKEDFGLIFAVGTWVYGCSFLLNGPVTDRIGGRKAMLISLVGSTLANLAMGVFIQDMLRSADPGAVDVRLWMSVLYGVNMYFQSFAAVAIVKVNASWFHVRERGGFSGIFGTMISSGIFFAYTGNAWILDWAKRGGSGEQPTWVVFYAPALLLGIIGVIEFFVLRDRPSEAGHQDFDTGDADSGRSGAPAGTFEVMKRIFTHPVILTIALIEFCTGVLRQGIMQWVPIYVKEVWVLPSSHPLVRGEWTWPWAVAAAFAVATGFFWLASRAVGRRRAVYAISGALCALGPFLQGGWGGLLFVAGVIGGNVAGYVSDIFFQSRRAPAAGGLYALLAVCTVLMAFSLGGTRAEVGWVKGEDGALKVGDRIVSIAGVPTPGDWSEVSRAVACIPARCAVAKRFEGRAAAPRWDAEACTCSTGPKVDGSDLPVSTGVIEARVVRDGQELALRIEDPRPVMTAGDTRTLPAGPKLTLTPVALGLLAFLMSLCVIGTHGLLSGTATMDFGGRRAAATAVGIIDGFVYLGSGLQAYALGKLTTESWTWWPLFLIPFAVVGTVLCLRIWNAAPNRGGGGGH
ncbi:MFS transporter [Myxococcota bacterium]|nr:MFS transporter [Myxococcota bacterium]